MLWIKRPQKNYKAEYDALLAAYTELQREQVTLEKEHTALIRAHHELEKRIELLTAERDVNAFQAKQALSQLEQVASDLAICMLERDAFKAELDALKQPVEVAPKRRSARAKQPSVE